MTVTVKENKTAAVERKTNALILTIRILSKCPVFYREKENTF